MTRNSIYRKQKFWLITPLTTFKGWWKCYKNNVSMEKYLLRFNFLFESKSELFWFWPCLPTPTISTLFVWTPYSYDFFPSTLTILYVYILTILTINWFCLYLSILWKHHFCYWTVKNKQNVYVLCFSPINNKRFCFSNGKKILKKT